MAINKRLKIIHVLFSKGFAGTERSTAESCNSQSEHHDVILVCGHKHTSSKSGATILKHVNPNVRVIELKTGLLLKSKLQKILDQEAPDVVHAHLRKSTRLLAKCRTKGVKVSTLHIGVNSPAFLSMDALIAISPWQLDKVPASFEGKLEWIRNSLKPHTQPSSETIKNLKIDLGIESKEFVVGGIGRLSNSKGWDTLIQAFDLANMPNASMVLIGEGSLKKQLMQQASKTQSDIRFEPFKHNVKDYYSTFDVFVCPSREEPMGRVILEALDCGTPVITSDIEGPKDILNEYPGTLFKVDDAKELSKALLSAYHSHRTKPVRCRPDLSPHYVEKVNSDMVDLYLDTISSKQTN